MNTIGTAEHYIGTAEHYIGTAEHYRDDGNTDGGEGDDGCEGHMKGKALLASAIACTTAARKCARKRDRTCARV